jgi:CheY-like chemotaxis protein
VRGASTFGGRVYQGAARGHLYRRCRLGYDRWQSSAEPLEGVLKKVPRILIVDDDPEVATMLSRSLSRRGFQIDSTNSPEEALARAAETAYDAALLDLVMPGRDGAELAAALRLKIPGLPVALLTGYTHSPLIAAAARTGVTVFTKPVVIQDLVDFLQGEIA